MRKAPLHLATAVLVTTLALVLTGCGRLSPLAPDATPGSGRAARVDTRAQSLSVRHFEGSTGPGSIYFLDVPEQWNHDLVVYAHGIVLPASLPIGSPNYGELRDSLLARGFAVAASSFDVNGYAVKDGFLRTHQLSGLFAAKVGPPSRTYLLGRSLGGLITQKLAETFPDTYAGSLSVSGPLCGSRSEMDYVGTVRVLFDYFFPGVLPGNVCQVPPTDFSALVPRIAGSLMTHPDTLRTIVALMGGRLAGQSGAEYVQSIVLALGFQVLGASNVFELTHDHCSFDNANVVYTSPYVPQPVLDALNAGVARYSATPDAVAYLLKYYEPTGNLLIPMLTLHNSRDPQVPVFHEACYKALVDEKGHGDNLVQRVKPSYGHDSFSAAEIASGFQDLVGWVEGGLKPLP